jgi:hypothetical protein
MSILPVCGFALSDAEEASDPDAAEDASEEDAGVV